MTMPASTRDELVERLAEAAHQCWADWQDYVHGCLVVGGGEQSYLMFPREWFDRWQRQISLPYDELRDDEKEADREVVRKYYLPIIRAYLEAAT